MNPVKRNPRRERWYDVPGALALVLVLGFVALLCLIATIGGWW